MVIRSLHAWTVNPKEAIALQRRLAKEVLLQGGTDAVRIVAGADVATYRDSSKGYAGVVVMTFPELTVVEEKGAEVELSFPYIPGLLAFREVPVLLEAFAKIENEPDLILVDGQGIAHPRKLGIASHLGLILNKPTIGCAKSRLYGRHENPAPRKGSFSNLYDEAGGLIGAVVRTKDRTAPIYVSIGHRMDLPTAIRYTLECSKGYRVPEPTRRAHLYVGGLRRGRPEQAGTAPSPQQLSWLD
jgi:deoxyribonuclease V